MSQGQPRCSSRCFIMLPKASLSLNATASRGWLCLTYPQGSTVLFLLVERMTYLASHLQLCQEFLGHADIAMEFRSDYKVVLLGSIPSSATEPPWRPLSLPLPLGLFHRDGHGHAAVGGGSRPSPCLVSKLNVNFLQDTSKKKGTEEVRKNPKEVRLER